jgi:hypothetical protein
MGAWSPFSLQILPPNFSNKWPKKWIAKTKLISFIWINDIDFYQWLQKNSETNLP